MAGICRFRTAARSTVRRLGLTPPSRSYGAAALHVEYDFEDEDDSEVSDGRRRIWTVAEPADSLPDRGVQWVVMGNPGAQKHVYAERLSKLLEVPHISMGSLVRQELNPRSSLYKQAGVSDFHLFLSFGGFLCFLYKQLFQLFIPFLSFGFH